MKNKNGIKCMSILFLAILLLVGVWMLYAMRYQGSDIHPYYSSYRSDRMGTKVLYESLNSFSELKVKRNLRPLEELENVKQTCLFVLGCEPFSLNMNFKEIENFALSGGRVIVSFDYPEYKRRLKAGKDKEKPKGKKKNIKKNILPKAKSGISGVRVRDLERNIKLPSKVIPKIPAAIPPFKVYSRNCFEINRAGWNVLATLKGKPAVIEKRYSGGGSIVLCVDSYAFSNEALATENNAELLLFFLNGRQDVVFDETHLGVLKTRNVIWLAKKFNLLPFLLASGLTLLLFIWRSFLVPYNSAADSSNEALTEDFSKSSLVNMLRANYTVKDLIKECWNEFNNSRSSKTMSRRKYAAIKNIVTEKGKSVDIYNNAVNEYKKREGLKDD